MLTCEFDRSLGRVTAAHSSGQRQRRQESGADCRGAPQEAGLDPKPSTLEPKPSSLNPQPSTLNPTPSTLNLRVGVERLKMRLKTLENVFQYRMFSLPGAAWRGAAEEAAQDAGARNGDDSRGWQLPVPKHLTAVVWVREPPRVRAHRHSAIHVRARHALRRLF
jgi:hypothetical protein